MYFILQQITAIELSTITTFFSFEYKQFFFSIYFTNMDSLCVSAKGTCFWLFFYFVCICLLRSVSFFSDGKSNLTYPLLGNSVACYRVTPSKSYNWLVVEMNVDYKMYVKAEMS